MRKKALAIGAALAVVVIGAAGGAYVFLGQGPDARLAACRGGQVGGGAIGGPFTLVDGTGASVTDRDVITRPTLVYFGYTFCPDVCPMDMSRNADAVEALAEQGHDVGLVFISVDPKRDTPQIVDEFATNIMPGAIGLTGTADQVAKAAKAYRVYYSANDDDPEYYTVDHTAFTYLMLPDVGFADFYGHQAPAEDIVEGAACMIDAVS